jgi:hypothetical protein
MLKFCATVKSRDSELFEAIPAPTKTLINALQRKTQSVEQEVLASILTTLSHAKKSYSSISGTLMIAVKDNNIRMVELLAPSCSLETIRLAFLEATSGSGKVDKNITMALFYHLTALTTSARLPLADNPRIFNVVSPKDVCDYLLKLVDEEADRARKILMLENAIKTSSFPGTGDFILARYFHSFDTWIPYADGPEIIRILQKLSEVKNLVKMPHNHANKNIAPSHAVAVTTPPTSTLALSTIYYSADTLELSKDMNEAIKSSVVTQGRQRFFEYSL